MSFKNKAFRPSKTDLIRADIEAGWYRAVDICRRHRVSSRTVTKARKTMRSFACLTHFAPHCDPPWLAVHRESALTLLDDYGLSETEKNDLGAMMAGFCNVLDNARLLFYGHSEAEAVAKACGLCLPNAELRRSADSAASQTQKPNNED